jgi:hypothetical protein
MNPLVLRGLGALKNDRSPKTPCGASGLQHARNVKAALRFALIGLACSRLAEVRAVRGHA